MGEEDEGRGGSRAGVVLLDQLVPLELPDAVRIVVHHLKGVAGGRRRPMLCQWDCVVHLLSASCLFNPCLFTHTQVLTQENYDI